MLSSPSSSSDDLSQVSLLNEDGLDQIVDRLSAPPWYQRLSWKVTKAAGWALMSAASATTTALNHTYFKFEGLAGRFASTLFPFSFGFSLGSLLSSLPSRAVAQRLQLEAWRLGIPLYFFLTQLYLNTEDEDEQKWLIDTMMGLWGMQISTLVDAYVNHHFHERLVLGPIQDPEIRNDEEPVALQERRFRLLPDYTPLVRTIKFVAMGTLGSGMVAGSFFIEDSVDAHILRNFGSFYIAESLAAPLWERFFERWGLRLEEDFERRISESILRIEPSRALKFYRVLKQALEIGLPVSIAAAFYAPGPWTLAAAGGMHGVQDELNRYPFTHLTISKIQSVKRRVLQTGRVRRVAEISWRAARIGTEIFGMGYFGYLVFNNGNSVDDFAIGTFIASTAGGYLSTALVDRCFTPEGSSPLMQTLFFRSLLSPEVLGIDPLYIYYYTVNYPIDIGSGTLKSLSLQQAAIAFLSWGAYGWRLGEDLAAYESGRIDPGQGRISRWLVFSNMVAAIQELEGVIS